MSSDKCLSYTIKWINKIVNITNKSVELDTLEKGRLNSLSDHPIANTLIKYLEPYIDHIVVRENFLVVHLKTENPQILDFINQLEKIKIHESYFYNLNDRLVFDFNKSITDFIINFDNGHFNEFII